MPVSESLLLNTLGSRPESLPQSEIYFKLKLFLKGRQKTHDIIPLLICRYEKDSHQFGALDKYTSIITASAEKVLDMRELLKADVVCSKEEVHWISWYCLQAARGGNYSSFSIFGLRILSNSFHNGPTVRESNPAQNWERFHIRVFSAIHTWSLPMVTKPPLCCVNSKCGVFHRHIHKNHLRLLVNIR